MRAMRRMALGAAIALAGCGGAQAARAPEARAMPVEWVSVPDASGGEAPREVRVLVDTPHLKLVAIVLRGGTPLPEHTAPSPVTIQAVAGEGVVRVGDEARPLDATHMVALDAEVAHAVEPSPGTDLVVLVHHLRGGMR